MRGLYFINPKIPGSAMFLASDVVIGVEEIQKERTEGERERSRKRDLQTRCGRMGHPNCSSLIIISHCQSSQQLPQSSHEMVTLCNVTYVLVWCLSSVMHCMHMCTWIVIGVFWTNVLWPNISHYPHICHSVHLPRACKHAFLFVDTPVPTWLKFPINIVPIVQTYLSSSKPP